MPEENYNAAFDREEQRSLERDYERWLDSLERDRDERGWEAEQHSHQQQLEWRRRNGLGPVA